MPTSLHLYYFWAPWTRPSSGMLSLLKRSIAVVVLKSILPCILRLPLPIAPVPILTAIIATNPPPLLAFSSPTGGGGR
ncbi:hypothetical protein SERLA73DRAFT_70321 [Serpula lacrymans var. lacrymans S7.3]|uniref:Uncharacterized protein n=2 Tax=Serpula lacrymans var. lacrymans (strain S7.3) TaxID=936435 RepID=F8PMK3_SERL3|nr:hypothetical protein SERLA73DRAFT_70321 [Serpula lacrymans var. lacrymans S7.3]